jgi:glycosyltransferase involved in cell wall biosynthesis
LNEEASVGDVVRSAKERLDCDVLVVDDGSSDSTASIARAAGALVLQHPFNLGVGAALRSGFRVASDRGYETVVQLDGDGQHDADDALKLLELLETASADIVIGSRFEAGYAAGRVRRASMRLLSRIVSRRLGVGITDTTSGFRAFGKRAIQQFARAYPTAYLSDTVEALLLAADWNFTVAEQPVHMHARQGGRPSATNTRSAFHFLRLSLVLLLHGVRRPMTQRGELRDVET